MGMTAEQFAYENLYWLFEKFSRDYYILFAAENFEHRSIIDTDAIVREIFGIPVNDYVLILVTVFGCAVSIRILCLLRKNYTVI